MTSMWIIAGYEIVDAADRDAYVDAHAELVRHAREAPGCLDVAITDIEVTGVEVMAYQIAVTRPPF
jgi:quinol monooxygenase YgiN